MALPLILAGLALSRVADVEAEDRRERLRKAMRAYQIGQSQKGQAAIEGLLQQQTPGARGAELEKLTAERAKSMRDTVGAVQASNVPQINAKPGADFQKSQEVAAAAVAERTRRAIEQLSAMGAPGEQAIAHGMRFGRAAGAVDAANSAIGNVGNAYMGDIRNTMANPGLKLLGSAAMAYGAGTPSVAGGAQQLSGPGSELDEPVRASKIRRAFSLYGRR